MAWALGSELQRQRTEVRLMGLGWSPEEGRQGANKLGASRGLGDAIRSGEEEQESQEAEGILKAMILKAEPLAGGQSQARP